MAFSFSDKLMLTAGFSALMKMDLEPPTKDNRGCLSLFDHHIRTFPHARVGGIEKEDSEKMINIQVINLVGEKIELKISPNDTVQSLKEQIQDREGIPPEQQRLIFVGRKLEDFGLLNEYSIVKDSVIHVVVSLRGGCSPIIDFSCIDSRYNYDFTNIRDSDNAFTRGGYNYTRPCGWKRFAIRVSDRYTNFEWLGCNNGPNEWPVSYHGTGLHQSKSIAQDGYDLTKGKRFKYGRGIYSTPDIKIAEMYAVEFQYESKKYKILLQNRVNL
jgi:hypothetical protein